jgi:hypothetical protein
MLSTTCLYVETESNAYRVEKGGGGVLRRDRRAVHNLASKSEQEVMRIESNKVAVVY